MSERKMEEILKWYDKSKFEGPIIQPYDKSADKKIDFKKVSDKLDKMLKKKKYIDTTKELIVFNMKLNNAKKNISTSNHKNKEKKQRRISRDHYKESIEKRFEKFVHNKAKKRYTNNKTENLNNKFNKMGKSIKNTGLDIIRPRHRIRGINRTLNRLEPYAKKVKDLANNRYIKKLSKGAGKTFGVLDQANNILKIATAEEKEKEILKTAGSIGGDMLGKAVTVGVVAAFPALIPIAPAISFAASNLLSKAGEQVGEFIYSKNKDGIKKFSKNAIKNVDKLKKSTKLGAKKISQEVYKKGEQLLKLKKHMTSISKKYIKKIQNKRLKSIKNSRRGRSLNNRNNSNNIRKKNRYIRTTPKIDTSKLAHKISGIFAQNISLRLANS